MGKAEGNIKIAKNTLIVYFRIFVTIVVGLLCARIVLKALGFDDYGLYNVVGSTVAMFGFITSALTSTTQRFINYEMGKPDGNPGRMFNICNVLHIGCAILLFVLIEVIGIIYIKNWLNVAPGKESDAMFVFQVSTVVACVGIMNIPYQSLFIAHERFKGVAIIDIALYLVKLALVCCLLFCKGNLLRLYAVFMSVSTFLSFVVYHILCKKYWPDIIKWHPVRGAGEYREALSFNGYNLLSSLSSIARSQGSPILINYFFGTTVNAAYGVGNTLFSYVQKVIGNFDFAAAPKITMDISAGKKESSLKLAQTVCRMSVLVMLVMFFTLFVELEFVLVAWLKDIPDGSVEFCKWMLIVGVVSATSGGLGQFISGYGKVKWFRIVLAVFFLSALVVSFFLYKAGAPPITVLIVYVVADVLCRIIQFILLHRIADVNSWEFVKEAYLRPLCVAAIMTAYVLVYPKFGFASVMARIGGILLSLLLSCLVAFFVGLKKSEKDRIWGIFSRKVYYTWRKILMDINLKMALEMDIRREGLSMDLDHPKDINEKIMWLMCHSEDYHLEKYADKVAVREYVKGKGYSDILIPLLGTWKKSSEIPYDSLPDKFVLKCNHDSGSWHLVDKSKGFDEKAIGKELDASLRDKFGYLNGEIYYNKISPLIMAEPFLEQNDKSVSESLIDYKVWCFDGKAFCIMVCCDRTKESLSLGTYDINWEEIPYANFNDKHYHKLEKKVPKPKNFSRMLEIAAKLSEGFPHVRVDFYEVDGKLYFGEMTFASMGGKIPYFTKEFLKELGDQCELTNR